jgi:hypothetical protein
MLRPYHVMTEAFKTPPAHAKSAMIEAARRERMSQIVQQSAAKRSASLAD